MMYRVSGTKKGSSMVADAKSFDSDAVKVSRCLRSVTAMPSTDHAVIVNFNTQHSAAKLDSRGNRVRTRSWYRCWLTSNEALKTLLANVLIFCRL